MLVICLICVDRRAVHRPGHRPRRRVPSDRLSGADYTRGVPSLGDAGVAPQAETPDRRTPTWPRFAVIVGVLVLAFVISRGVGLGGDPGGGRREGHPAGRFRPRGHAGPLPAPGASTAIRSGWSRSRRRGPPSGPTPISRSRGSTPRRARSSSSASRRTRGAAPTKPRSSVRLLVLQHIACEHPGVFSEVIARAGRGGRRGRDRRGRAAARLARVRRGAGDGRADGSRRRRDHPWLAQERRLVARRRRRRTPGPRRLPRGAAAGGRARRASVLRGRAPGGRAARGRAHRRGPRRPAVRRASTTASSRCNGTATPSSCRRAPCAWRARRRRRTRPFASASAPTGSSSISRSRPRWPREWATIPAYRESLADTLGERRRRGLHRRRSSAAPASCTRPLGDCSRTGSRLPEPRR